jgi:hypothetical protein
MGSLFADMRSRAAQDESPQISRARGGGTHTERLARESSVVVIKTYFGLLACTLVGLYL